MSDYRGQWTRTIARIEVDMPYDNMPKSMWAKMDSCVEKVQGEGKSKDSAIAICYTSMMKGKEINYRKLNITDKAITDVPNLRGDDARTCWNCNYFKSLPDTAMSENMNDMKAEMHEPSNMVEISSGRGICTQFDFETDREWVCDAWEQYEPQLVTMKQADGKYRWVMFSSSSYQDRDNEIVSQKALEDDMESMNTTKEFGTLDWWHTPLILGNCDFSAMHGRISIESGTFNNDWIGERFATMKGLGASRMFFNPINEPDAQGVYHNIRTFSRAILPAERASNRLTLVDISAKEKNKMLMDKVNELIKRLGGDETAKAKVEELLSAAEKIDKAAQVAGLTSKEAQPEPPAEKPEDKKPWFVGDMTPDEFDARLGQAVEKFLTPAVKEIGAQVAKMNETQQVTAKESSDKITATIKSMQDMQTDIAARLAALEGLKPRGYTPTADPGTIVSKEIVDAKKPKGDKEADAGLAAWLAN
jgi:hypothetical protein